MDAVLSKYLDNMRSSVPLCAGLILLREAVRSSPNAEDANRPQIPASSPGAQETLPPLLTVLEKLIDDCHITGILFSFLSFRWECSSVRERLDMLRRHSMDVAKGIEQTNQICFTVSSFDQRSQIYIINMR